MKAVCLEKDDLMALKDLSPREMVVFAPLCVSVLWMGIYPSPILNGMAVSVEALIHNYDAAILLHTESSSSTLPVLFPSIP